MLDKLASWFRSAVAKSSGGLLDRAATGDPRAQALMAHNYFFGVDGHDQDYAAAVHWAQLAAAQGEPLGQFYYAQCLLEGVGIPRDVVAADAWFLASAQLGNEEAQCMAGNALSLTKTEKFKWLLLAEKSPVGNTSKYASENLAALKPYLSESQVKDATAAASLWSYYRQHKMQNK